MSKQKRVASIFDLVRMCKYFVDSCEGCPLEKRTGPCPPFDFSEENNKAVLKWCDEHPAKTYLQDFSEKFPRFLRKSDGTPNFCRDIFYGIHTCDYTEVDTKCCAKCWNEVMPEEETK